MVFFCAVVGCASKKLGFLMPKIIHKAAKENGLNVYLLAVQKLSQVAFKH